MTTPEMELAVAGRFGVFSGTRYVVLPRSRWGLATWGIYHECDLLALSRAGVLHEIEIKISRSDLLADAEKRHAHESPAISKLWYAVPKELEEFALEHIPGTAGLIRCYPRRSGFGSVTARAATGRRVLPAAPEMVAHIHELIACRYWSERERGKV